MRGRCLLFLFIPWLAMAVVVMGGCASRHDFLAPMEGLYVEPIPSSRVFLSNISARQEGDELVISGEVSRRNAAFSGMGHVDLAVISPGGAVIDQANVSYTPRILPKTPGARKHHASHFEVCLPCIPPRGSVIRVAYHGKPDPDDPLLDCDDNAALPHDHDYGS